MMVYLNNQALNWLNQIYIPNYNYIMGQNYMSLYNGIMSLYSGMMLDEEKYKEY